MSDMRDGLVELIKATDKIREEHDKVKDCYTVICDEKDCYTCSCEERADYLLDKVRVMEYAEWYYDPNGMDWGLGAWLCSKCQHKNDNLGGSKNINPYMFSGSKFCPQCGAVMKPKEKNKC